ncbi:MAG: hypothetical protein K6G31_05065 [Paludibacteraceae bacterium]|nr:hypothetical protein [Paludibacteraceae bacterium]MCR5568627.1 hypothetical protein [Paludibacteraceae bacterium]
MVGNVATGSCCLGASSNTRWVASGNRVAIMSSSGRSSAKVSMGTGSPSVGDNSLIRVLM